MNWISLIILPVPKIPCPLIVNIENFPSDDDSQPCRCSCSVDECAISAHSRQNRSLSLTISFPIISTRLFLRPCLSLSPFYFASFSLVHSFNRPRCVTRWVIDIDTQYARSLHNAVQFNWAEARSEERRKEGVGLLLLEEPPGLHYKCRDR